MKNALPSVGLRTLLMLASLIIILSGIKAASQIVVPFLLALFLSIVLYPIVRLMSRWRIPSVVTVLLIMLVIIISLFMGASLVGSSANEFTRTLPQYRGVIGEHLRTFQAYAAQVNIDISSDEMMQYFDPGALVSFLTRMLSGFSGMMTSVFLLLMTVVFMLLEVDSLPKKLGLALQNPEERMLNIKQALDSISRYLAIKTAISLVTGLIIWGFLSMLDVKYALLWGVLGFLLNYVPNIGSVIAAIPPILQSLLFNGLSDALIVTGYFIAVNIIIGNIIEPRIMGRGLGLSTLVVFLSLIFWGWLLGPIGMLLSVPLTIVAKIMLEANPSGKRLAILLGDGK